MLLLANDDHAVWMARSPVGFGLESNAWFARASLTGHSADFAGGSPYCGVLLGYGHHQ